MSNYKIQWVAEGYTVLEFTDSAEATQEALDRLFDLEHADASVTFVRVSQIKTTEV